MTAGHLLETLCRHFSKFSLPLEISTNIVPDDGSTLFICSGMQPLKPRFQSPDGLGYGSIQDCIRVNDIDIVGDGSHLTFFQMVGSFGFGTNDYEMHIDLWDSILTDLKLGPLEIHIYPGWDKHKLWTRRGYQVISDLDCTWSDGTVSGMCSEVYLRGLEIGNLVNPLGHSVDVGFGFERLLQVISGADRVDETEVFRQDLDPISRDHYRTLTSLFRNGVEPG